jgi:hypothetical protein
MLTIIQHSSPTYPPRTYFNATHSDITIAFAIDFSTAGEKLTKRAAGERYFSASLFEDPIQSARAIYRELRNRDARTINIAGNGIYALAKQGWTQEALNVHLFNIFSPVHEHWKIAKVLSGGQPGVDIAGIIVAQALGIPATATLPYGFIQRGLDNKDCSRSENSIKLEVYKAAELLNDGAHNNSNIAKPTVNVSPN